MISDIDGFKKVSRVEYNSIMKKFGLPFQNTYTEMLVQEISDYHDIEYFYTYDLYDNAISIMINDRTRKSIHEFWKAKTTYYIVDYLYN